jgi:hypothetical protein
MNRFVRLYPASWRVRYGAEFEALLADRPPSLADRIDIVRGAFDARLHPQRPGQPIPIGHRMPGLAVALAGLLVCIAFTGIALTGPGADWGGTESLLGIAVVLGIVGLPGTYMERYARPLQWAFCGGVGLILAAAVLPWPLDILALFGWWTLLLGGSLALAAARAGLPARASWMIVGVAFVPEFLISTGLSGVGAGLDGGNDRLAILALVLPYGLAWLLVGLLLMARGSPTFDDPVTSIDPATIAA